MTFPNEDEPDGDRFLPHHYLHGSWVIALIAITQNEPWLLTAIVISLFGWYHAWPRYHAFGATLTLMGLNAAVVVAMTIASLDTVMVGITSLAYLWALDDAAEHAWGIWTPLDWLWMEHLRFYLARFDPEPVEPIERPDE